MRSSEQGPRPDFSQRVNSELLRKPEKLLAGTSGLITGSTRLDGIGFAIAEGFALEGMSPIILVGTPESQEESVFAIERLKRYGIDAHALVADVTNEESVHTMMQQAYNLVGGNMNVLVNNAGVNINKHSAEITLDEWRRVHDTKMVGTFLVTQAWFNERNKKNIKGGRVINIGSVIGLHANFGQAPYEAANGGLVAFTKGRALEYGRQDITVNLIAPGFVGGTQITRGMDSELEAVRRVSPIRQVIDPRDVAEAAVFLAGPGSAKINGITLPIDAGVDARYTALYLMHQAGYRMVPEDLQDVMGGITDNEAFDLLQALQTMRRSGGNS